MFSTIYVAVLVIACVAILVWNFVPSVRAKLQGWSTIAEAVIGAFMFYFGQFAGAIQEAQTSGYIPSNWAQYVPFILLAWVVIKRIQTATPVGVKLDRP
jgi:hypothetical protein